MMSENPRGKLHDGGAEPGGHSGRARVGELFCRVGSPGGAEGEERRCVRCHGEGISPRCIGQELKRVVSRVEALATRVEALATRVEALRARVEA